MQGGGYDFAISQIEHCYCVTQDTYIVRLRYKCAHDGDWFYTDEILTYDCEHGYTWLNDWWEGQQYIEVKGILPIGEIPTGLFHTIKED